MAAKGIVDRPTLRLAAREGRGVEGPAREVRPLTACQAEDGLIASLSALRAACDPADDFAVQLAALLARMKQRRARRPGA